MVEFIRQNPATLGRFQAQEQQRAQNQEALREEQGFRERYAHETAMGVDSALRNALSGVTAQGTTPQAQQANTPAQQGPRVGPQLSGSLPGGGGATAQASAPNINPDGSNANDRVVQALSQVQGGGALALKRYSENQANHAARQDALEDRAWNIFANAKRPADLEMANAVFKQATGKDFPPQWRNHQAALKAATVDAAARERYPRDVVQRRKFIEVGMTQGLDKALQSMVGESIGDKNTQMTPQQVFNMAVKAHTVEDTKTGFETTDWGKVQAAMAESGYGAQGQAIMNSGGNGGGAVAGMDYTQAVTHARGEAKDQAGFWRSDETDFKDYGGSRERFITERTQQLMGGGNQSPRSTSPVTQEARVQQAPRRPDQRKVGAVYETPRGPMKWMGNGWLPMQGGG